MDFDFGNFFFAKTWASNYPSTPKACKWAFLVYKLSKYYVTI